MLNSDSWLENYLHLVSDTVPYYVPSSVLFFCGAIFAVVRMRRHRTAMTVALTGFFVYLCATFIGQATQSYLWTYYRANRSVSAIYNDVGYAIVGVHWVGLALITAAVFVGRSLAPRPDGAD